MYSNIYNLNNLTAAILAGGQGTRLRSAVSGRQKVMAEVKGRPFLAYLLDKLENAGIKKVVLCTGYLGEELEKTFKTSWKNMNILYSKETAPLGTGGALRKALPLFDSKTILVMNGDSYCNADLIDFYKFHVSRKSNISVVLTSVDNISRYGMVKINNRGLIKSFAEKPEENKPGLINGGIYLIKSEILLKVSENKKVSLEKEIFPSLAGENMYGYKNYGNFIDIGTPETYREGENFFYKKEFL